MCRNALESLPLLVTAYSQELAHLSVNFASAAYCANLQALKAWNCAPCSNSNAFVNVSAVVIDSVNDINAYVGVFNDPTTNQETVLVSFRGTEPTDYENWVTDLDAFKTYPYSGYPSVGVHKGFYNAWLNFKPKIYQYIKSTAAGSSASKALIVGHSLGGALATMCAMDLFLDGDFGLSVGIFTFGSPRVGDLAFSELFDKGPGPLSYRVVHYRDLGKIKHSA